MQFTGCHAHIQELLADMLMTGLRFNVVASFFDQSTLCHDLISGQFLSPSVPALGHIRLGLRHEIYLHQFIQAHTLNGHQRLPTSDVITQLDMDALDLSLNSGHNFGDLLQIERHFAWGRHHFLNHVHCDRVGPYSIPHGRRGLNGADARSA
jgi:hypothetical protein